MLSRFLNCGVSVPNQKDAIDRILNEYEYVARKIGVDVWSGKVKKEIISIIRYKKITLERDGAMEQPLFLWFF